MKKYCIKLTLSFYLLILNSCYSTNKITPSGEPEYFRGGTLTIKVLLYMDRQNAIVLYYIDDKYPRMCFDEKLFYSNDTLVGTYSKIYKRNSNNYTIEAYSNLSDLLGGSTYKKTTLKKTTKIGFLGSLARIRDYCPNNNCNIQPLINQIN